MLPMNCVYFSQFSLILSIIYSVSYSHNLYPVNPNPNHRQPVYHQTNGHFSGVKPNPPNPPSVKQWETRTWISTIPLSKAQDVNREPHSLSQSPPPQPPSLSSLPVASSDHRHEDYNYARYTPKVTEYVHRAHGSHPYRPVLNATQYSTVRSPEPMKPCRIGGNSEKCRKSPFQGTYDTINYQKKFIYPEKSAGRQVDESYGTRYRQSGSEEEDYDNRGGNVHWTPHNHHGRWEDSHPRSHQSSGSYGGGSSSGKRDRHPEKTSYHHSSSYSSDHEPWQENSKYKDHPKNGYEYDDNDYDKEREWRTGSSYTSQENYPNEKEERPTPQPAPAKKNKPKVREFHHDDDNPDGFSHAHGYEKVEEEGTRFFEPSELQSYDESLPLDPRNRDNLASIPKSKTGMKHCDCSHANMPRYQSHLVDRMSRPLPKKYESGAELDQSSAPEYRADSGEYSSQETKSIPGVVLGVKGYSNTTGF